MRGIDITKNRKMERDVQGFVDIFVHGTISQRNPRGKRRSKI
jgi:hypothetical protein